MEIKKLYRYERKPGKITVSPEKPDGEYTDRFRLIADEGKAITLDGENLWVVVDVDDTDGWYEVDAPFTYEETDILTEQQMEE